MRLLLLISSRLMDNSEMRLINLNFATMMPSWTDALRVGDAWFPMPGGSLESRWVTHQGSQLLSAIALYIRETASENANMELARQTIHLEATRPGKVLCAMSHHHNEDVTGIAKRWNKYRGRIGWDDPILFLLLNITDWRAKEVTHRWPFGAVP
jgi:hypothetical protein